MCIVCLFVCLGVCVRLCVCDCVFCSKHASLMTDKRPVHAVLRARCFVILHAVAAHLRQHFAALPRNEGAAIESDGAASKLLLADTVGRDHGGLCVQVCVMFMFV